MNTLFLYSNLNSVFDFIGRNFVGCFEAVPERTGTRTISFLTQKLIFVTHKKLNEQQRNLGLGIHPGVYSIILSIVPKKYVKGKFPAILVNYDAGNYKYEFSDLKKYDDKKHIGAFIIGEIPFSLIEDIFFMSDDEKDAFSRPSSDYWYPENKFKVADKSEFIEELPVDFAKTVCEEELLKVAEAENQSIAKLVCEREKLRACLLNAVEATKNWRVNGYVVNIDSYLQKTFKLVNKYLTQSCIQNSNGLLSSKFKYEKEIGKFAEENIELLPIGKNNSNDGDIVSVDERLYRFIFLIFIEMKATDKHNPQDFLPLIEEISKGGLFKEESDIEILRENYRMISGNSNLTIENLMSKNEKHPILNAIFFVMKNPSNYQHFSQSLSSYHVDQITVRRAMILWGALNGLNGVPGETTYKSCQPLWSYIDAISTTLTEAPILITMPMPANENRNEVIGIKPLCNKVIGFNDVFAYVSNAKNILDESIYKKAVEIVRNITVDITVDKYYSVDLDKNILARKAGSKMPKDQAIILKQYLERLLFEQPNNNFDQKQFLKDWFKDKDNFLKLYQRDEAYWVNLYKNVKRGVKADEHL